MLHDPNYALKVLKDLTKGRRAEGNFLQHLVWPVKNRWMKKVGSAHLPCTKNISRRQKSSFQKRTSLVLQQGGH